MPLAAASRALAGSAFAAEPVRGTDNSWRMVFNQVNAAGGINRRKIKYIIDDNQCQVRRSVRNFVGNRPCGDRGSYQSF